MEDQSVLLEISNFIAIITLNRPFSLNTMNQDLVDELTIALRTVKRDTNVRAVILTGNGKAFCAGGDLGYLESIDSSIEGRQFIANVGDLVSIIMNLEKPVVAMVNGVAAGAGFNLALACDIVYCAQSARFAQSFVKVGLVPDCGGMYLLPRIVGLHKAKELMFTADLINADTALQLGLVNKVVEDDKLKEETYAFVKKLANSAPIAIGFMKNTLNRSDNLSLDAVLDCEAELQSICMQTEDHKEGVRAFKEKRNPIFTGK
jgi:2-(1,2-epoxy-1,2-dihydrophenyl)acetyl-CoA isomerase